MRRSNTHSNLYRGQKIPISKVAPLKRIDGILTRDLASNRTVTGGSLSHLWGLPKKPTFPLGRGYDASQELINAAKDVFIQFPPDDCQTNKAYTKGMVLNEQKYLKAVVAACDGHIARALACIKNLVHCYEQFYSLAELCKALKTEVQVLQTQLDKAAAEKNKVEDGETPQAKVLPSFQMTTSRMVQRKLLQNDYFSKINSKAETKDSVNTNQGDIDIIDVVTRKLIQAEQQGMCHHGKTWIKFAGLEATKTCDCDPFVHTNRHPVKTLLYPTKRAPFYPAKEKLDDFMKNQLREDEQKVHNILHGVSEDVYKLNSPVAKGYRQKLMYTRADPKTFQGLKQQARLEFEAKGQGQIYTAKKHHKLVKQIRDDEELRSKEPAKTTAQHMSWDSSAEPKFKFRTTKRGSLLQKENEQKKAAHTRRMQHSNSVPMLEKARVKASQKRFQSLEKRDRKPMSSSSAANLANYDQDYDETIKMMEVVSTLIPSLKMKLLDNALVPPPLEHFSADERKNLYTGFGERLIGQKTARASIQQTQAKEKAFSLQQISPLPPPHVLPSPPVIIPEDGAPPYAFRSKRDITEEQRAALFKNDWVQLKPNLQKLCVRHFSSKDDKFKQIIWSFYVLLYQSFLSFSSRSTNDTLVDSVEIMKVFTAPGLLGNLVISSEKLPHPLTVERADNIFDELHHNAHPGDGVMREEGELIPTNFQFNRVQFFELLIRFALVRCQEVKFNKFDEPEKFHFFVEKYLLPSLPRYVLQFHSNVTRPEVQEEFAQHSETLFRLFNKYAKFERKSTKEKIIDLLSFEELMTDTKLVGLKQQFTRQNALNLFYLSLDENESIRKPALSYPCFLEFIGRAAAFKTTVALRMKREKAARKARKSSKRKKNSSNDSSKDDDHHAPETEKMMYLKYVSEICTLLNKRAPAA